MKRILACVLAGILLLLPAVALAEVLPGYTSKVDYENTDPSRYRIEVDRVNCVVTVYERDDQGNDGAIVLQGLCTPGSPEHATTSGVFELGHLKERFGYFVAYGQYAQWWSQITRGIYFHTVMYDTKSLASMSENAYRQLGSARSHGCVRLLPEHAKWIYYNCPPGTLCEVTKAKPKNAALVERLKKQMVPYAEYQQPIDTKPEPLMPYAVVNTDDTRMRSGFSSMDATVGYLNAGDAVHILQLGPDWCKVETADGSLGYIKTYYLTVDLSGNAHFVREAYATADTAVYQVQDTEGLTLADIPEGSVVNATALLNKFWYLGGYEGVNGYLRAKYIKHRATLIKNEAPPVPVSIDDIPVVEEIPVDEIPEIDGNAMLKPTLDTINLREGPGTRYPILTTLAPGTDLNILGQAGSWYEVEQDGAKGYISVLCVS